MSLLAWASAPRGNAALLAGVSPLNCNVKLLAERISFKMSEDQTPPQDQEYMEVHKVAHRSEDFDSLYANNVLFDASVWDLKMIFGNLGTSSDGKPEIDQHTSIAIPWPVAKIACMYLVLNIIAFENDHGAQAIHLLPSMLGMLRLNDRAKSDPRIMTVFTALMSVGNPDLFAGPVVYAEPPHQATAPSEPQPNE
jgi:hypothetical protein